MPGPLQPPADLPDAQAVAPDPVEDLPHHGGLRLDHLVAGQAAARGPARVAIAVRGVGQDAHGPLASGMALAPPAALDDLGPLVLGNHPLDLEQQVVLRRPAERAVEEDHLDAGALELVEQQDLVAEAPRQPIGGMDVEALEIARGRRVAQALQGGPNQAGAAVAVVDEAAGRGQRLAVLGDARLQGGNLAGDGAVLGLLFRGDTGVNGNPQRRHVYLRAGRRE